MFVSMKTLEILSVTSFVAAVGVATITDMNGNVAGLPDVVSHIVKVTVYVIAFAVALDLTVRGRGLQKILGVIPLVVYLAFLTLMLLI